MSQRTYLIVLTIAIIYVLAMCQSAEAKRVGCASFGHSCYGGFGKRSLMPTAAEQQQQQQQLIDLPLDSQRTNPLIKVLQHRLQFHPELNEATEQPQQDKEFKLLILSTMSQVIDEATKRMTGDYESAN